MKYFLILAIGNRASYKEFGHSHWWELIEIFVPKFGIWFSSLFPKWELIPTGIPTGRNWLKSLFPNLGFGSPAYSQSGNWFPQEFPLEGIDWNIWISLFLWHSSKTGNWLNLISPHWELVENFVPIWDWELIEFNFPTLGIGWNFCSHFWELIQKKNPTSGNWLTFFIPKNGKMGLL